MHNLEIFAAKSSLDDCTKWISFKMHSQDTAGIIELLFRRWLPQAVRDILAQSISKEIDYEKRENTAKNFCVLIALLHDIGKLTPAFQSKITANIEGHKELLRKEGFDVSKVRDASLSPHDFAGQCILDDYGFSEEISALIGAHHGRALNKGNQIGDCAYDANYFGCKGSEETKWRALWKKWVDFALAVSGFEEIKDLPRPNVKEQFIFSGLLIMSDWIASNTNYFPHVDISDRLTENEQAQRVKLAYKRLDLPDSFSAESVYDSFSLFTRRFDFRPNKVQTMFLDTVSQLTQPEIVILEAPMGIGKTEAALAAAEILAGKFGEGGIYFGLPTQATANGIFSRINDWAKRLDTDGKHTIRLAHRMTDLNAEYRGMFHGKASDSGDEAIIVHEWFEGKKQALLSDFVVATVDQFLLASLKQKHVMLRHLGLAGKVVIIDECHAYDAYMNVYLDRTLTWLGAYGVPAIILSATLPSSRREGLIKAYLKGKGTKNVSIGQQSGHELYPKLTYTSTGEIMTRALDSQSTKKIVKVTEIEENDLPKRISQKLCDGGCAAVIVNAVIYAQAVYEVLSRELVGYEVVCFHSQFVATDRAETESKLLTRVGKKSSPKDRDRLVVVATQVLEQSLDLDFDYMVTELCPIDLLLQRLGRLQRHDRDRPVKLQTVELALLNPSGGSKSNAIYSSWILRRTRQYLPKELELPECIPFLVDSVYSPPQNEEERNDGDYKDYARMIQDKQIKADKYCIKFLRSKYAGTIAYLLDNDVGNDSQAKAAVRDSEETIEVLVMQETCGGKLKFLPWHNGGRQLDTSNILSEEDCIAVAKERVTLPYYFSKYRFRETISSLTDIPKRWRQLRLLDGELVLALDNNYEAVLCGKVIRYSREKGLYICE